MNGDRVVNGKRAEDKVIINMPELEPGGSPDARATMGRADEPSPALARGTRDRVRVPNGAAASAVRSHAPCELERDPVAVLRTWPHSKAGCDEPAERTRAAPRSPRAQRRIVDKIVLAHLALDLYQEMDELEVIVQRANGTTPSDPEPAVCTDPCCTARTHVLRGALVEACLLVQRVAMMAPTERVDIEDRIHELLELLER